MVFFATGSGYTDKECYYCNKRVWFFQKRGVYAQATPDVVIACHKFCEDKSK